MGPLMPLATRVQVGARSCISQTPTPLFPQNSAQQGAPPEEESLKDTPETYAILGVQEYHP